MNNPAEAGWLDPEIQPSHIGCHCKYIEDYILFQIFLEKVLASFIATMLKMYSANTVEVMRELIRVR